MLADVCLYASSLAQCARTSMKNHTNNQRWRADADMAARGVRLLARCQALTGGLVGELVEQLRLVLEPTTASRMTGDYKTGADYNFCYVYSFLSVSI